MAAKIKKGDKVIVLAAATLVAAGAHDDGVALLDLGRHHSTSGASEMIFM